MDGNHYLTTGTLEDLKLSLIESMSTFLPPRMILIVKCGICERGPPQSI